MSQTPNYDTKVKVILDATIPGERTCELTGEKWNMTDEEIGWYRKFNVPPSRRSPLTRWWTLTGFWLAYQWWWNKHAETGKPIFTYVHPATGLKVLPDKEWFEKDFSSTNRHYDANRSFFQQLREIQLQIPLQASQNTKEPEQSISLFSFGDVNSYFVTFCRSRDTFYSIWGLDVEDSAEIWNSSSISRCYHVFDSHRMHFCQFAQACLDCSNSAFLFDCRNCEYCFGAANKRNRKYLWFNEQLSKEEWEARRKEVDFGKRSVLEKWKKAFEGLMKTHAVWPENFNEKAQESVGEYLTNVHRIRFGYACMHGPHDCYQVIGCNGDTYDCAIGGCFDSNNCYYTTNATSCSFIRFSYNCSRSLDLEYCLYCYDCESCFGCVGIRRKKFHIFNKPYGEEEYWRKVDELKSSMLERGEYGEFFPLSMSPSCFEASGATMYVGAPREIGQEKLGAMDFDSDEEGAFGEEIRRAEPKTIEEIPDSVDDLAAETWANVPIYDPELRRRFVYLRPEIEFYHRHRIGPPRRHFILRTQELHLASNSGRFEQTTCGNCGKGLLTATNLTYSDRNVFCRECYLNYLERCG
ncbi:MAG TPA: hypothetical protein VJB99_02540 [Patescibacteria group bacterium]|nr:hypothetical protein [Patescibacteria group bacterium]